ncbi:glycosyl transferase family 2 [Arcticibacter pallidicorallinus]|uniref:Glycosyl transferase family 2 n=1 Tax=Arcticibacter pallidicorallinus TaxID=1259464 RepID=A0A2T0U704_9SPHI|nr:glycosyltransferase [Arcticibacter pallidicorallinus]PRY53695.1 glycosyl transferase family 2 [Arcticibacter pallidicorallinus]
MDYSIIVCTYNQEDRLLERCLDSIQSLELNGLNVEIILVDNNSNIPLAKREGVIRRLQSDLRVRIVSVLEQGLIKARLAGIKEAKGSYIVFFDDDNEPDKNYLLSLSTLWETYPDVGAWGPGIVEVDFVDGVASPRFQELAPIFQQKRNLFVEYAMIRQWQSCYPLGTGLCIKRELTNDYVEGIEEGRFSLTGRNGGKMTSGDDTQLVMTVIAQGKAAGTSPSLSLIHMITSEKLKPDYLKKLVFGTSSCYHMFHVEVLPEYSQKIESQVRKLSKKRELRLLKEYYKLKLRPDLFKTLRFIESLGSSVGVYYGNKIEAPAIYQKLIRKLKLD